jgi:hypothetical protein
VIHWIARAPDLYEARVVLPNGHDVYAGYIVVSPGADRWRGYVGYEFFPLGQGPFPVMQRLVEQRVAEIMQHGGEDLHHTL